MKFIKPLVLVIAFLINIGIIIINSSAQNAQLLPTRRSLPDIIPSEEIIYLSPINQDIKKSKPDLQPGPNIAPSGESIKSNTDKNTNFNIPPDATIEKQSPVSPVPEINISKPPSSAPEKQKYKPEDNPSPDLLISKPIPNSDIKPVITPPPNSNIVGRPSSNPLASGPSSNPLASSPSSNPLNVVPSGRPLIGGPSSSPIIPPEGLVPPNTSVTNIPATTPAPSDSSRFTLVPTDPQYPPNNSIEIPPSDTISTSPEPDLVDDTVTVEEEPVIEEEPQVVEVPKTIEPKIVEPKPEPKIVRSTPIQEVPKVVQQPEPTQRESIDTSQKHNVVYVLSAGDFVQLGSFRELDTAKNKALALLNENKQQNYPREKILIYKDENSKYFKLLIGPFNNSEIGVQLIMLRNSGYRDAFVVKN